MMITLTTPGWRAWDDKIGQRERLKRKERKGWQREAIFKAGDGRSGKRGNGKSFEQSRGKGRKEECAGRQTYLAREEDFQVGFFCKLHVFLMWFYYIFLHISGCDFIDRFKHQGLLVGFIEFVCVHIRFVCFYCGFPNPSVLQENGVSVYNISQGTSKLKWNNRQSAFKTLPCKWITHEQDQYPLYPPSSITPISIFIPPIVIPPQILI